MTDEKPTDRLMTGEELATFFQASGSWAASWIGNLPEDLQQPVGAALTAYLFGDGGPALVVVPDEDGRGSRIVIVTPKYAPRDEFNPDKKDCFHCPRFVGCLSRYSASGRSKQYDDPTLKHVVEKMNGTEGDAVRQYVSRYGLGDFKAMLRLYSGMPDLRDVIIEDSQRVGNPVPHEAYQK